MLQYARQNTENYQESGQVVFNQADAADFRLSEPVALVVSTYDSLNHLEDFSSLKSCFRSLFNALVDGGTFIFDLNTRSGTRKMNAGYFSLPESEPYVSTSRI
jgi:SAM-dependent methyltransferase